MITMFSVYLFNMFAKYKTYVHRRRGSNVSESKVKKGRIRKNRRRKIKYQDSNKACVVGTSQLAAFDSNYEKPTRKGYVRKHTPQHKCCYIPQDSGDWSVFGEGSVGAAVSGGRLMYGPGWKVENSFGRWREKIEESQSLHFQEFVTFIGGNDEDMFLEHKVRKDVLDEDDELRHRVVNGGVQECFSRIGVVKAWLHNGWEQQRREVSKYLARLNSLFFGVRGRKYICSIPPRRNDSIYLLYAKFCFNMHLKHSLLNSLSTGFYFVDITPIFDVGLKHFDKLLCHVAVNDHVHYNGCAMSRVADAINDIRLQSW